MSKDRLLVLGICVFGEAVLASGRKFVSIERLLGTPGRVYMPLDRLPVTSDRVSVSWDRMSVNSG